MRIVGVMMPREMGVRTARPCLSAARVQTGLECCPGANRVRPEAVTSVAAIFRCFAALRRHPNGKCIRPHTYAHTYARTNARAFAHTRNAHARVRARPRIRAGPALPRTLALVGAVARSTLPRLAPKSRAPFAHIGGCGVSFGYSTCSVCPGADGDWLAVLPCAGAVRGQAVRPQERRVVARRRAVRAVHAPPPVRREQPRSARHEGKCVLRRRRVGVHCVPHAPAATAMPCRSPRACTSRSAQSRPTAPRPCWPCAALRPPTPVKAPASIGARATRGCATVRARSVRSAQELVSGCLRLSPEVGRPGHAPLPAVAALASCRHPCGTLRTRACRALVWVIE